MWWWVFLDRNSNQSCNDNKNLMWNINDLALRSIYKTLLLKYSRSANSIFCIRDSRIEVQPQSFGFLVVFLHKGTEKWCRYIMAANQVQHAGMHSYSMITMYSELTHKLSLDWSKTEASTLQHQCQLQLRSPAELTVYSSLLAAAQESTLMIPWWRTKTVWCSFPQEYFAYQVNALHTT